MKTVLIFIFDAQEGISPPGDSGFFSGGNPRVQPEAHSAFCWILVLLAPGCCTLPSCHLHQGCPFCEDDLSSELLLGLQEALSPEQLYPWELINVSNLGTIHTWPSPLPKSFPFVFLGSLTSNQLFSGDFHDKALEKGPFT